MSHRLHSYASEQSAIAAHAEAKRLNRRPFSVFWHVGLQAWAFWAL